MFEAQKADSTRFYRVAIVGLLGLSAAALAVTLWTMVEYRREQAILRELVRLLPAEGAESATALVNELRWQFRLATLVVLNLVATGIALVLLTRAYSSSQRSLSKIKFLASDILNSMDQAVLTTDLQGRVTSINRRGLKLLGIDRDILSRPLADAASVIDLESFRREALERANARTPRGNASDDHAPGEHAVRDYVIHTPTGDRTLAATAQPLRDATGQEIGAILQILDVTERALMQQQVQRMERFSGLGPLAAGLHHEIKNPLAALSLHVQLLEEHPSAEALDADARELLEVLKTEIRRITSVLESFRSYAALERLDKTLVNLNAVVQRQIKLMTPQFAAAQIDVVPQYHTGLPPVRVDQTKIERVVLNLLLNALESTTDGGTITVSTGVREGQVWLRVRDTGRGIPEDLEPRIFDPYFTTKVSGTGMGLPISEKIARQHGGTLTLCPTEDEAADNEGTIGEIPGQRTRRQGVAIELALPLESA